MRHWILFPPEEAFYPGMGRELYEMEKDYRSFCRSAEKKLGIPLHHSLFYWETPYPPHMSQRRVAVMVISLANFNLYRKTYPEAGEMLLCGQGMGLLTALVVAEAISMEAAAEAMRGKKLSARNTRRPKLPVYSLTHGELKKKEQILRAVEDALKEKEVFVLPERLPCLDIGPGRACFDAQPWFAGTANHLAELPISRLDEPGDPQYIWSGFQLRRLWSRDYCAKRLFGIAAATHNQNDNCNGKKLDAQEKEMRELLKPLFAQEPQSISQESFERCVSLLRENFEEKHTPAEEIELRLRLLEQECLIPICTREGREADHD